MSGLCSSKRPPSLALLAIDQRLQQLTLITLTSEVSQWVTDSCVLGLIVWVWSLRLELSNRIGLGSINSILSVQGEELTEAPAALSAHFLFYISLHPSSFAQAELLRLCSLFALMVLGWGLYKASSHDLSYRPILNAICCKELLFSYLTILQRL